MKTAPDRRPGFRGRVGACGALVVAAAACSTEFTSASDEALAARCAEETASLEVAVRVCEERLAFVVTSDGVDERFGECLDELRAAYEPIAHGDCGVGAGRQVSEVAARVLRQANAARHDDAATSAPLGEARPSGSSAEVPAQLLPEDDPRFADIRRRLGILNEWLDFSLDLGFPIDDLPSELSELWRDAYAVPPAGSPDGHVPGDVLAFLDQMDQFLVVEGLSDPDYVPLMRLHIEAIALARIAREVETRADVVRVLCHLGDCGTNIAVVEVAQAIVALRDDDLSPPAGTALGDRARAWVATLGTAHEQRDRLRSALEELADDAQSRIIHVWIDGLRLKLQELASDPGNRFPLATRLHDENRQAIRTAFATAKRELDDSVRLFNQARLDYARSQIAALGQEASELGMGNELLRATEVLVDAQDRADGLRALYDDAKTRWEALGDFTTRVDNLGLRGEVVLSPAELVSIPLPTSAKFTADDGPATPDNIADRSVHSWNLAQGDTLRFSFRDNQWSPTCALRTAHYRDNPLFQGMGTNYVETGPEGYYLQFSESRFEARSASVHHQRPAVKSSCGIAKGMLGSMVGGRSAADAKSTAPIAPAFLGPVGNILGGLPGFMNDCVEQVFGGGMSGGETKTRGNESRWNAAFSAGLRLENTPFPTLPTGSLVLAVVAGDEIVEAYVMRENSAMQMPVTGQAYLVVNDIHCADSSGLLRIDWVRGESLSDRAGDLAGAMTQIATDAQGQIDQVADLGLFTTAHADHFRTEARQRLRESCGSCPIETVYPPAVLGMFDEWVSYEVAQMQRKVDLRRLEFEVRLQSLAIEGLSGQVALEAEAGRWTEYVKQLAFTELADDSLERLENALESAAEFLDQRILPVLQVRYPEVLIAPNKPTVDSVTDLDLSMDRLAADFHRFAIWLDGQLDLAETGPTREQTTPVFLWIPKPGAPRTFENGTVRVLVADADDIANVWQAAPNGTIELADNAQIRVATRELYSGSAAVVDRLACRRTAPIIRGMMLYAVDENSEWESNPLQDPMNVNRFSVEATLANPLFVTDIGTREYDLVAGNTGELRVARGTFGNRATVANAFLPATPSSPGETSLQGLSPFLDIQLEGAGELNPMLTSASGLALVLHVSSYTASVSHCN